MCTNVRPCQKSRVNECLCERMSGVPIVHLVVLILRPTRRREFMISRIEKNADFIKISGNVVLANLK